ncbi:MAG: Flp pilus assembly protein CpaB [Peptococcales bacterium]|jgi:pilus assembly protein CpaB
MRNKIVIIIALVFGLLTTYLVLSYIQDVEAALDENEYVEIVVANQDILANTQISASMISMKKIPFQYTHALEITDKSEVIGNILTVPINLGESILKNQVIAPGDQKEGLAYLVPKGKRALTIPVDEVSGISGLIKPGDRVDVIGTVAIGEDNPKTYTLMVLQDIEVLATGKLMDKNSAETNTQVETKTITLAVTLSEAKPLMMASQRGVIRLMLRSPVDDSTGYTPPFTMEEFLR